MNDEEHSCTNAVCSFSSFFAAKLLPTLDLPGDAFSLGKQVKSHGVRHSRPVLS